MNLNAAPQPCVGVELVQGFITCAAHHVRGAALGYGTGDGPYDPFLNLVAIRTMAQGNVEERLLLSWSSTHQLTMIGLDHSWYLSCFRWTWGQGHSS